MSSKCEWKDGDFYGCDRHRALLNRTFKLDFPERLFADGVNFCPFCGASIKKPVDIKVGMFGKFWNTGAILSHYYYGILFEYDEKEPCPYRARDGKFMHFTPGLPTEFNQDGSPKEGEE